METDNWFMFQIHSEGNISASPDSKADILQQLSKNDDYEYETWDSAAEVRPLSHRVFDLARVIRCFIGLS